MHRCIAFVYKRCAQRENIVNMAGEAMYTLGALILLTLAVGFLQVVNSESCSVMMSVDAGQDGHLLRQQTMSAFRATCREDKKNKPTAVTNK